MGGCCWAQLLGWAAGFWLLLPLYPLLLVWTTAPSGVAVPAVGSGSPPMPVERGTSAFLLERSLSWLSWGWHCPLLVFHGAQLSPEAGGHSHPCWWLQGGEQALAWWPSCLTPVPPTAEAV